ncbi:MAG: DNA mismatch repair protein MutS [Acidobacteria bacterium]|jgi:DNA mismatch repair protein MutS|nr:DNA mismatch repair protein MutS [Acidobacteriota bacterium]
MKNETPIRRQYLEIKAKHKESLLLFRMGDFYEAFDDDARILARELDIALTSRSLGKESPRVPLAGVPHFVLEKHLATLISRGHRVAICEQTSATSVKGEGGKRLFQREVVRVVTAGTIIEPQLLDSKSNNYLVSFISDGNRAGIAYADITTGDFAVTEIENKDALAELQRLAPAEILLAKTDSEFSNQDLPHFVTRLQTEVFDVENARKTLLKHFNSKTLKPFGLENSQLAVSAAGALIFYLNETQSGSAQQLTRLTSYDSRAFMLLDARTLRSLEIFESATETSLWSVIDRTKTAMGGRLLRRWIRQPLLDCAEIYRRQEHLAWFKENESERNKLQEILSDVKDLERLSSGAKANFLSAYELRAFGKSLELIPKIKEILRTDPIHFGQLLAHLPECVETANLIEAGISEELPSRYTEQVGIIRNGFSEELDKLRLTLKDGKVFLAEMEKRERERTGIRSLRVGFNKVFGYFIEVTKPNIHLVPENYTRKQTLVPSERYITLELKEYESLVIHAEERIAELENNLFRQICLEVSKNRQEVLLAASTISYLDAICGLADVADEFNYVRPTVNETSLLRIKNGRHAVIETLFAEQNIDFVANDAALGGNGAPQIALITGPNASGKSTYLRQISLIVLLAQIGSFVPADEAVIGICDRIFTRIGLYDRIGSGESTFMTEMIETAEILHHATPQSLILLDELGRGTSTYDGLAVARAVLEYIHNHPKLKTRTLFATHYHELAEIAEILPRLDNFYFLIDEEKDKLTFKYKIAKGTALKSYGVYAAQLAGLPKPVVHRAEELLEEYEKEDYSLKNLTNDSSSSTEIERSLAEIDTDNLSPVEALMKIYELKNLLATEKQFFRKEIKAVG